MVDHETFRRLALAFPGATEEPHHGIPSFRCNKRIFATLHEKDNRAMVRLSLVDQSVFCDHPGGAFYPVPGGWGQQGATYVDLKKVRKDMFRDALTLAYEAVAKEKPGKKVKKK